MDFAILAIALTVIIFAIQVPLDPKRTTLQRVLATGIVMSMAVLILAFQLGLISS